jgi:hypothetical protein
VQLGNEELGRLLARVRVVHELPLETPLPQIEGFLAEGLSIELVNRGQVLGLERTDSGG